MGRISATVLISCILWLGLGYIGVAVLKYQCIEVMPKIYKSSIGWNYWGYGAHQAARATFVMGPLGLWSQVSQVRKLQKEYGKDKVKLGIKF